MNNPWFLVPSLCYATINTIQFQNSSISPKRNPVPISTHFPLPRSWKPLIYFLSLMHLHLPDISYKWNHTIHDLSCLASFTCCDHFRVHPCCNVYLYFLFFFLRPMSIPLANGYYHILFIFYASTDAWIVLTFWLL